MVLVYDVAELVDDNSLNGAVRIAHKPPGKGKAVLSAAAAETGAGRGDGDAGGAHTHGSSVLFHKCRYDLTGPTNELKPFSVGRFRVLLGAAALLFPVLFDPDAVFFNDQINFASAEELRRTDNHPSIRHYLNADAFSSAANKRIIRHRYFPFTKKAIHAILMRDLIER